MYILYKMLHGNRPFHLLACKDVWIWSEANNCVFACVVAGDRDLLCHNATWHHLVEHCKEGKGCLVESDAFPSEHFIQSLQQAKAGKNKK